MAEIKLSDDVFEQIKDFDNHNLTEEQESLIDKLITDKELKELYKVFGLCKECKQPNTGYCVCWPCILQHFKQNFKNWTSGNHDVDEFIKKAQLKAKDPRHIIEWIEYDKFEDVEYLAKGGFGTTFKAVWKDGNILRWNYDNNQWKRNGETKVALKCLYNSQGITADFLKEVESNILVYHSGWTVCCFGITKDPKTNNFMMVMQLKDGSLRQHLNNYFISLNWSQKLMILQSVANGLKDIHHEDPLKRPNAYELSRLFYGLWAAINSSKVDSVIYRQVKETDDINKNLSSSMDQPPLSSTSNLLYTTHPQAVYTSSLLDFKNLPEPKNADNTDLEYSDSLKMDFTKLDINSKDGGN
ncbi:uncharacterized protein OCT59_011590 [Rhizophagus irregularis]|uniref:uncharacterized protein n=1 Tax=Rhizophagus irregularis TaxID=588596 RepID=UPI0033348B3F|nr:hypothetical protein OCT59_011590 [Rhizophagus irregularis]